MSSYGGWPEYVPVAVRRAKAEKEAKKRLAKGQKMNPVVTDGRKIATTFWGKSWCENLEAYSDYANRLPRGRTYVRNGSVIDLQITHGRVKALVSGSELYDIEVSISSMSQPKWDALVKTCTGKIDSLIELLQGKFSKSVMEILTQRTIGLFPNPNEIKLSCSCPDWAEMCKHVAATLYGVGAILDNQPELLFILRQVNHLDLIASVGNTNNIINNSSTSEHIADDNLADIFGIEMDSAIEVASNLNLDNAPENKPKPKKTVKPKETMRKKITKVKETTLGETTKSIKSVTAKTLLPIKVKVVRTKLKVESTDIVKKPARKTIKKT